MAVTGHDPHHTLMFFYVAHWKWRTPLWLLGLGSSVSADRRSAVSSRPLTAHPRLCCRCSSS